MSDARHDPPSANPTTSAVEPAAALAWTAEAEAESATGASGPPAAAALDGLAAGHRTVHDEANTVVATVAGGNFLADEWTPPAEWDGDLIVWSGTVGDDLTEAHPHTWMGLGRDRLAARVDGLLPTLSERGVRLLLRAHARQVLSDPPSIRAFFAERAEQPVGLILEPAALFEASMLGPEAEDHLGRILAGLGDLTRVLLLSDVVPADTADAGDCPRLVAAGTGRLPAAAFEAAAARWVLPSVPRMTLVDRPRGGPDEG